jgi:hypothetical protein
LGLDQARVIDACQEGENARKGEHDSRHSKSRRRRAHDPTAGNHCNSDPLRFIGSARRERLAHVIVFNATGLQRIMNFYCACYHGSRTHLSLAKDAPTPRRVQAPDEGRVIAFSEVGGLHHRYERRAP